MNKDKAVNEIIPIEHDNIQTLSRVNTEQALADWKAYQKLCDELLDPSDYQGTGDKAYKKKSAWRKLGKAFNITTKIIDEEITRDDNGQIISAMYKVEASTPDGRTSLGIGTCSIYDKISMKNPQHKKYIDKGENVPSILLRLTFSNPEHDIPATGYTRAVNRAISDHIGCGEVSAEEMSLEDTRTTFTKKTETKTIDAKVNSKK